MTARLTEMTRRGRRLATALMVDEVTVTREQPGTLNASTGLLADATSTVIASRVPCRVRVPTSVESTVLFGEEQITQSRYVVCVPFDTLDEVQPDDIVEVVSSEDTGWMVGRRFRVLSRPATTFTMYRAVPCELVE